MGASGSTLNRWSQAHRIPRVIALILSGARTRGVAGLLRTAPCGCGCVAWIHSGAVTSAWFSLPSKQRMAVTALSALHDRTLISMER